jgi:hypothetical protein
MGDDTLESEATNGEEPGIEDWDLPPDDDV